MSEEPAVNLFYPKSGGKKNLLAGETVIDLAD